MAAAVVPLLPLARTDHAWEPGVSRVLSRHGLAEPRRGAGQPTATMGAHGGSGSGRERAWRVAPGKVDTRSYSK